MNAPKAPATQTPDSARTGDAAEHPASRSSASAGARPSKSMIDRVPHSVDLPTTEDDQAVVHAIGMWRQWVRERCGKPHIDGFDTLCDMALAHLASSGNLPDAERARVIEECAQACEDEKVDSDATGEESDHTYNTACDHCAVAIRALAVPGNSQENAPATFANDLVKTWVASGDATTAPDQHRGLYNKYHVERLSDPTGKHAECEYFVLDLRHDEFATAALQAYANACVEKYPLLAADLKTRWTSNP